LVGLVSTATINSIDACPTFNSDIAADLTFFITFGLEGGALRVTVNVAWDLKDLDVFWCGVAMVVLPGLGLTVLAGVVGGPIGAIIGVVLTIGALIAALVVISDKAHGKLSAGVGDVDPGSLALHTVESDDDHAVIEGSVPLKLTLPGMEATMVLPSLDGLLVAGTLAVPAHQERSLQKIDQSSFDWQSGYSCSAGQWQLTALDATLGIEDPAMQPVEVTCEVLTDPLSAYSVDISMWGFPGPTGVFSPGFTLSAHSNIEPGGGGGPDCELLISTNSGVRYANLGHEPPAPLGPSSEELIKAKLGCFRQTLPGPKKWLEAQWLVDPPWELPVEQVNVWELVASGLPGGILVDVATVKGQEVHVLGSATTTAEGAATFWLATSPGQHAALSAARGIEGARLFAGGARLEAIARFTLQAGILDAAVVGTWSAARVVLATADRVMVFGLDGTDRGVTDVPGVVGVAGLGRQAFAHDGRQVFAIDTRLPMRSSRVATAWLAGGTIQALHPHASQLEVTTTAGTVVLDRRLRPTESIAIRGSGVWYAEPWLRKRPRQGGLFVRANAHEAVVFRCARVAVF
jgi:hypothetical protein